MLKTNIIRPSFDGLYFPEVNMPFLNASEYNAWRAEYSSNNADKLRNQARKRKEKERARFRACCMYWTMFDNYGEAPTSLIASASDELLERARVFVRQRDEM